MTIAGAALVAVRNPNGKKQRGGHNDRPAHRTLKSNN